MVCVVSKKSTSCSAVTETVCASFQVVAEKVSVVGSVLSNGAVLPAAVSGVVMVTVTSSLGSAERVTS